HLGHLTILSLVTGKASFQRTPTKTDPTVRTANSEYRSPIILARYCCMTLTRTHTTSYTTPHFCKSTKNYGLTSVSLNTVSIGSNSSPSSCDFRVPVFTLDPKEPSRLCIRTGGELISGWLS